MFTPLTRRNGLRLGVAAALAIGWYAPFQARGDTWYVDVEAGSGGDGTSWAEAFQTIGEALDNLYLIDGDTILVADGTYSDSDNRDLSITGLAITIQSANGPENCIIDCDGSSTSHHRAFAIYAATEEVTRIEGFTIREGYVYSGSYDGGAILNTSNGKLEVVNCVFELNYARGYGGAIHNSGDGEFEFVDCIFTQNSTYYGGGAIYNDKVPTGTILRCTFEDNEAWGGGAMESFNQYEDANVLDVVNCEFIANYSAGYGGAITGDQGHHSTITNCRFAGNSCYNSGGVVHPSLAMDGGAIFLERELSWLSNA